MLTIKSLSKTFGKIKAVNNVSFEVSRGETLVLMGPSGCGKSTTIRMINRLIEPDYGKILFNDIDITALSISELRQTRQRIGFVFQHFNLIHRLTAVENVMLGMVMSGIEKEVAYEKALASLDKVGLKVHAQQKPDNMSGGQQQRVGIARALTFEPELILWDEPTASLDPILVKEVLVVMENLAKHGNIAMIVVTHELPFAINVADRIILMEKGSIVEEGIPQEVFVKPKSQIGNKYKELIEYQMTTSAKTLAGLNN